MPLYLTRDYALFRTVKPQAVSISVMSIMLHWALVFYYAKGFYVHYIPAYHELSGSESWWAYPVVRAVLFTGLLLLATLSYWKAALVDPGHIDYDQQFKLSADKLNLRLAKFIFSKETQARCESPKRGEAVTPASFRGDFSIEYEHTETELVEQESCDTERLDLEQTLRKEDLDMKTPREEPAHFRGRATHEDEEGRSASEFEKFVNTLEDTDKAASLLKAVDPNLLFKTCSKCPGEPLKPQRAHHCSTCGKCCLKMDHHCQWLGSCVGLHNQRYFLQYGLYVLIMNCILIPSYIIFLIENAGRDSEDTMPVIVSLVIAVYTTNTAVFMAAALYHLHVHQGLTLIESRFLLPGQKLEFPYNFFPQLLGKRQSEYLNPFSLGKLRNLELLYKTKQPYSELPERINWLCVLLPIDEPLKKRRSGSEQLGLTHFPLSQDFVKAAWSKGEAYFKKTKELQ